MAAGLEINKKLINHSESETTQHDFEKLKPVFEDAIAVKIIIFLLNHLMLNPLIHYRFGNF